MANLENPVAIVTGASSGIGRSCARMLAEQGVTVVINARRAERLESLPGTPVAGDITDPAVREAILEACGGRVDILVNNAGYGEPGAAETVAEKNYRRQLEVNFFAAGAMMQLVSPLMRAQRSGRIINISSVAGRLGYPLFGWYCASKHALEGLSDAARIELSPWGVRVVLVEPGPVETEFFEVSKKRAEPLIADGNSPYQGFLKHADAIERKFMKQATTADNVARVVMKACRKKNPRARYAVTGMAKVTVMAARLLPRRWLDAMIKREFRVPKAADVS